MPQCIPGYAIGDQVTEYLRNRIETAGTPSRITVGEEMIHASVMLPLFYQRRIYEPAWSSGRDLLPQAHDLLSAIKSAELEGLNSEDYHIQEIHQLLKMIDQHQENKTSLDPRLLVDLDLLLTDAFLIYGAHLLSGKVSPEKIDAEWLAVQKEVDLSQLLESALEMNKINESLQKLLPHHACYWHLRDALTLYKRTAAQGDCPSIPKGPKISRSDRGERVTILRERLNALGDLDSNENTDLNFFDERLEQAVLRFQMRHGLDTDGVVGPSTLAALNVPLRERVQQIKLNMERWRWLPQELGSKYILINIANFELDLIEENQKAIVMRVVVGTQYRRTPVFSAKMTYLVINPFWNIPHKIAVEDKLPLIKKESGYLEKQKIRIFKGWGIEAKEIDPGEIGWINITEKDFTFRMRQDPGPLNALGRIKFMFPNKFSVYLHDTPTKEHFTKTERTFSSGCIRIEKPIELAEYLLHSDSKWTKEAILSAIDKGEEQTVSLPHPIDVHLLYCTAWADEDGTIQFRKDIYQRDERLAEALLEKSPQSSELK